MHSTVTRAENLISAVDLKTCMYCRLGMNNPTLQATSLLCTLRKSFVGWPLVVHRHCYLCYPILRLRKSQPLLDQQTCGEPCSMSNTAPQLMANAKDLCLTKVKDECV